MQDPKARTQPKIDKQGGVKGGKMSMGVQKGGQEGEGLGVRLTKRRERGIGWRWLGLRWEWVLPPSHVYIDVRHRKVPPTWLQGKFLNGHVPPTFLQEMFIDMKVPPILLVTSLNHDNTKATLTHMLN